MADLDRAQKVEGGIILDPGGAGVFQDSFDPAVGGFAAAIGSLFLRNTTGQAFRKTGAGDTDWTAIAAGGVVFPEFQFNADNIQSPTNSDWTINALAPASADLNNAGLTVRLFDDTTEEGMGFELEIPSAAVNMVIKPRSRAVTAPPAVRTVGLKLYQRGMSDNAAVDAWSAGVVLNDIDIPTNEFFQEDSQTLTLATLGVVAGELTQFELTRVAPGGGTNLVGDWGLKHIKVSFT